MISVEDDGEIIRIRLFFTPTVPHCNLVNTIGLCIREKLFTELPRRIKVSVEHSRLNLADFSLICLFLRDRIILKKKVQIHILQI
jgi:hypothetical protein